MIGDVWVAWLDPAPMVELIGDGTIAEIAREPGRMVATANSPRGGTLIFRETFDAGWRADVDGRAGKVVPHLGTFLGLEVPAGRHLVTLTYDPIEVRVAWIVSLNAFVVAVFALTDFRFFRFTRSATSRLGRIQALGLESDS